jgi:hypothetical protein
MSQYRTGTVQVTNASQNVVGTGTAFVGNVSVGDIFTVDGDNVWYEVATVTDNTHLAVSANYQGSSGSSKAYAVSKSFTPNLGIPYPEQNDVETASLFKRAMLYIESFLSGRLARSVAGNSNVTLTALECRNRKLHFTGALTGNINVIVVTKERAWMIYNNTSGAFTLTVKPSAGTGIPVGQGKHAQLACDGTNVIRETADV